MEKYKEIEGNFIARNNATKSLNFRLNVEYLDCRGFEGNVGKAEVIWIKDHNEEIKLRGSYFVKTFDFLSNDDCQDLVSEVARDYLDKYNYLRENKFPVIPLFLYSKECETILMTDMTENGKNIIMDRHMASRREVRVRPANYNEVFQNAKEIALKAYKKGIELNMDAYALIMNKETKIAKIVLLDIGLKSRISNNANTILMKDPLEEVSIFFGLLFSFCNT